MQYFVSNLTVDLFIETCLYVRHLVCQEQPCDQWNDRSFVNAMLTTRYLGHVFVFVLEAMKSFLSSSLTIHDLT